MWGMDGWNGMNVKAECCERRVREQPQASLFICLSLDPTVLPGMGLLALSWPCNTVARTIFVPFRQQFVT